MHFYCVSILVCNSEFIRSTMTMKNVTRVIAESLMMHSSVRTWTLNGVCLIIIFIKFHSASFLLSTLIFCYHVPWPGFSSPPEYIGVVAPPQQYSSSASSIPLFPSSATPPQFEDLPPFPEVHPYVSRAKCLAIEVMNHPSNEASEQNVNAASRGQWRVTPRSRCHRYSKALLCRPTLICNCIPL